MVDEAGGDFAKKVGARTGRSKHGDVQLPALEAQVCFSPEALALMKDLSKALHKAGGDTDSVHELASNRMAVNHALIWYASLKDDVQRAVAKTGSEDVTEAFEKLYELINSPYEAAVSLRIKEKSLAQARGSDRNLAGG